MTSSDLAFGARGSDDPGPPTAGHRRLLGAFTGSPDPDADETTWDAWADAVADAIEAARREQSAVTGSAKGGRR